MAQNGKHEDWRVVIMNDGAISVFESDMSEFIAQVGHLEGKPDVAKMRRDAHLIAALPKAIRLLRRARGLVADRATKRRMSMSQEEAGQLLREIDSVLPLADDAAKPQQDSVTA